MSVELDVDGFLYHNIPHKDVTKVDIINRIYSEPQKQKQKLWQSHKKREKEKQPHR